MTPAELKSARHSLGLSAREMARALEMKGQWSDRTIRKWETEGNEVPGPVGVAVRLMLEKSST